MADPDRFELLPDLFDVAAAFGHLLDEWVPEYLRAVERQNPELTVGKLPVPGKARVRHAGFHRRSEKPPLLVVFPVNVGEYDYDASGSAFADVTLGVYVLVAGNDEAATTRRVHYYATAVRSLLIHRALTLTLPDGPASHRLWPLGEDDSADPEVEKSGVVLAGITLSYVAPRVYLGRQGGGPPPGATPRDDPAPPFPQGPTIQLPANVQIDPVGPDTPLFPGT